eukprot:6194556-Pleurochrysis_carterae.AAC.5
MDVRCKLQDLSIEECAALTQAAAVSVRSCVVPDANLKERRSVIKANDDASNTNKTDISRSYGRTSSMCHGQEVY